MLKRIKIQGFKSLHDIDVRLEPMTVLFGPNAAGKSNFLDALQLLSRMATSRTLKEAFEPPYRGKPLESFTFGPQSIRGLLEQERARFSIEVDVELSVVLIAAVNRRILEMRSGRSEPEQGNGSDRGSVAQVREPFLRYRLEVEILPRSGMLRVADEYLAPLNSRGEISGRRNAFLESADNRLHLRMERQAHPTYHDRYLDHTLLSQPFYPPHYPHLTAMRQELASWLFFYFEPRERMRAPNPVKEVRHIGLMGEELAAFLNTLKQLDERQFRAVERALHMIVPSVTGIEVEVNNLGEVELRLREGNMPVPASVLSEGTLRALGLLALGGAQEPPALIGFEEPENGIHPRRIALIGEMLRTRAEQSTQLVVTTHSPILLDKFPTECLLVCSKRDGHTHIEPLHASYGEVFRQEGIEHGLDDHEPDLEPTALSERMLRGDFDA